MRKQGRTFFLLRFHDGEVDVLASTTGNVLEGESALFSTYAIAYKDAEEPVSSTFYFKKVWEGSAEKSIDFTLYSADGKVVHQGFEKHILTAKEWSYSAVFKDAGSCYVVAAATAAPSSTRESPRPATKLRSCSGPECCWLVRLASPSP